MKKYFFITFLSLFIVRCSSDDNDFENCNSNIPFLVQGSNFKYEIEAFGFEFGEMTFQIGNCEGDGFKVKRTMPSFADPSKTNITEDIWKQDGDFLLINAENGQNYWSKTYKKNVTLGEVWKHEKENGTVVTHKVVKIDTLITVPAGTFKCNAFEYSTDATFNKTIIYWNDEVGNVKEDGISTSVLISYNIPIID